MSQVSEFYNIIDYVSGVPCRNVLGRAVIRVTCKHVNVKVYHVKFEVIRKYFSSCKFDILISLLTSFRYSCISWYVQSSRNL